MRNKKIGQKANKNKSGFKRAATPEMIRKQRAAIIAYYVNKRKEERSKGK